MAGNLNKVQLIGRLGGDPDSRNTPTGSQVVNFRLATTRTWKNSDGEQQEKTEWHPVVVWGPTAGFVSQYVGKGDLLYVEGRLETRSWQDKDDAEVTHYRTEIIAEKVDLLSKKGQGGGNGNAGSDDEAAMAATPARAAVPARSNGAAPARGNGGGRNQPQRYSAEEDLPF